MVSSNLFKKYFFVRFFEKLIKYIFFKLNLIIFNDEQFSEIFKHKKNCRCEENLLKFETKQLY